MTEDAKAPIDNVVPLHSSRAGEAISSAAKVARDHPLLVVAGGIAVGAVVAALLPKRTTGKLTKGARHLASVAGTAGLALGRQAIEKSSQARDAGRDIGRQAIDRAEEAGSHLRRHGEAALDRAEDALATARDGGSKLLSKASEKASEIAGRIRG